MHGQPIFFSHVLEKCPDTEAICVYTHTTHWFHQDSWNLSSCGSTSLIRALYWLLTASDDMFFVCVFQSVLGSLGMKTRRPHIQTHTPLKKVPLSSYNTKYDLLFLSTSMSCLNKTGSYEEGHVIKSRFQTFLSHQFTHHGQGDWVRTRYDKERCTMILKVRSFDLVGGLAQCNQSWNSTVIILWGKILQHREGILLFHHCCTNWV